MLLAGPIELSPGLTLVIMAILGVVGLALCLAGGLLARVISRHPAALPQKTGRLHMSPRPLIRSLRDHLLPGGERVAERSGGRVRGCFDLDSAKSCSP